MKSKKGMTMEVLVKILVVLVLVGLFGSFGVTWAAQAKDAALEQTNINSLLDYQNTLPLETGLSNVPGEYVDYVYQTIEYVFARPIRDGSTDARINEHGVYKTFPRFEGDDKVFQRYATKFTQTPSGVFVTIIDNKENKAYLVADENSPKDNRYEDYSFLEDRTICVIPPYETSEKLADFIQATITPKELTISYHLSNCLTIQIILEERD